VCVCVYFFLLFLLSSSFLSIQRVGHRHTTVEVYVLTYEGCLDDWLFTKRTTIGQFSCTNAVQALDVEMFCASGFPGTRMNTVTKFLSMIEPFILREHVLRKNCHPRPRNTSETTFTPMPTPTHIRDSRLEAITLRSSECTINDSAGGRWIIKWGWETFPVRYTGVKGMCMVAPVTADDIVTNPAHMLR
jgi:hypothetical protein